MIYGSERGGGVVAGDRTWEVKFEGGSQVHIISQREEDIPRKSKSMAWETCNQENEILHTKVGRDPLPKRNQVVLSSPTRISRGE